MIQPYTPVMINHAGKSWRVYRDGLGHIRIDGSDVNCFPVDIREKAIEALKQKEGLPDVR